MADAMADAMAAGAAADAVDTTALKKIQAATGLLFAAFVALHLFNTWLAALGPEAYNGVQVLLRSVYQFPPLEALLLAALAVHVVVGVMRIVREPKRVLNLRARLHRYAGFFLMLVIVGHILAVRGSSWFFDVYPGFAGLAFSVAAVPGSFYPYYFLLGVAGFYHAANGSSIAAARLGWSLHLSNSRLGIGTALAAVGMSAALLGFGGWLFEVGDPWQSDFAALALELVGERAP